MISSRIVLIKTASTFTRGYLKTYARFVGTDEQAVLAAYDRLGLKKISNTAKCIVFQAGLSEKQVNIVYVFFLVLFIGLAGLGITWWWLQPAEEPVPTAINEAGQLVVKATDTAVLAENPVLLSQQMKVGFFCAALLTITSGAEETTETSADLPVAADNEGQEPTVLSNARS